MKKNDIIWHIVAGVLFLAVLMVISVEPVRCAVDRVQKTWAPNLTAQQAQGIVVSAIHTSTEAIQQRSNWYRAEFNYSTRQWMITVWATEEDSKQYAGAVYIVDDATGKLLNPPPIYNPK